MKSFKFKAFAQEWRVRIVKNHPKIVGNFGHCDMDNNTIWIASNASEVQQKSTLLHEIIHLVEQSVGLNFSEHSVLALEAGLFHILRDNEKIKDAILR